MHMLVNIVGFKVGWISSVMGAASEMPWLGPVVFAVVVLVHLSQARRPDLEIGLVLAAGILGIWFDSFIVGFLDVVDT